MSCETQQDDRWDNSTYTVTELDRLGSKHHGLHATGADLVDSGGLGVVLTA